jgi:hypothetical protein
MTIKDQIAHLVTVKRLVPADVELVAVVLALPCDAQPEIAAAIDSLTLQGRVRIVMLGSEAHLAIASTDPVPPPSTTVVPTADKPVFQNGTLWNTLEHDAPHNEEVQLEIMVDAESERLMLYRVALVFLIIAGLLIVRQIGIAAL